MADVRVKIDASSGQIELEGDREFVSGYLDKLIPLLKFTHTTKPPSDDDISGGAAEASGEDVSVKKKRKVAKRPAGAQSCRDRILILKNEKFFSEKQTPTTIITGLEKKGWTHKMNNVTAALTAMFTAGQIQRTKEGEGFKYYWDRD